MAIPTVPDAIRTAVAFDECKVCSNRVAWVDATKGKNGPVGGSWIHLHLPMSTHVAVPLKAAK
jgi:predicted small secreted protein